MFKGLYESDNREDEQILGGFVSFMDLICRKKGFGIPVRSEVLGLFETIGDKKMFSYGKTMWDVEREEGFKEGIEKERKRGLIRVLSKKVIELSQTLVERIVKIKDDNTYDMIMDTINTSNNTKECRASIERILSIT